MLMLSALLRPQKLAQLFFRRRKRRRQTASERQSLRRVVAESSAETQGPSLHAHKHPFKQAELVVLNPGSSGIPTPDDRRFPRVSHQLQLLRQRKHRATQKGMQCQHARRCARRHATQLPSALARQAQKKAVDERAELEQAVPPFLLSPRAKASASQRFEKRSGESCSPRMNLLSVNGKGREHSQGEVSGMLLADTPAKLRFLFGVSNLREGQVPPPALQIVGARTGKRP